MSERPPGVTDELLAEVGRAIGGALITRETMFVAAERALKVAAPVIAAQAAAAERDRIRRAVNSDGFQATIRAYVLEGSAADDVSDALLDLLGNES